MTLVAATALSCGALPATAETSTQFWPEIDGYFRLTDRTRLFLMATASRAEQAPGHSGRASRQDMQLGAHLDVTLSPVFRTDLAKGDWQRNRYLWMRIGYRYRLRLQVEKSYKHEGRALVPFVNAEAFYDTRYDAWIRERYQLGMEIELSQSWRLEPALTHQADERSSPGRINALGLTRKYFQ
jgi:hypothetical protein